MKKRISLLPLLALMWQPFAQAQTYEWKKLSHKPAGIGIRQLEVSNSGRIYAITDDYFVFSSTDNGSTWIPFELPPFTLTESARSFHLNKSNDCLFIGTEVRGISFTSDLGMNWGHEFLSTDLTSGLNEGVGNIQSLEDTIVLTGNAAPGSPGVQRYFYSVNNGTTWIGPELSFGIANDLMVEDGRWISACNNGLQFSSDHGDSWTYTAFAGQNVVFLEKDNTGHYFVAVLTAPNTYEIYKGTSLTSWTLLQTVTRPSFRAFNYAPQANGILMATSNGLEKLDVSSGSLSVLSTDFIVEAEECTTTNAIVYSAQNLTGVMYGLAPGYAWDHRFNGLINMGTTPSDNYTVVGDNILSGIFYNRIISRMQDLDSLQWSYHFPHDPANPTSAPMTQFLGSSANGNVYTGNIRNLYRSVDTGSTWQSISPATTLPLNNNGEHFFNGLTVGENGFLFARQEFDSLRVYLSSDNGNSWNLILDHAAFMAMGINPVAINNVTSDHSGKIYVTCFTMSLANKFLVSSDSGNTWTNVTPTNANLLGTDFNLYFDQTDSLYIASGAKIFSYASTLVALPLAWDPFNVEINGIELAFTSANKLYVNVKGSVFCGDCAVYAKEVSGWTSYGFPAVASGPGVIHTPVYRLHLLHDTVPVVVTNYPMLFGPYSTMGYYYLSPVDVSSTQEWTSTELVTVYPNPAHNEINIVSPKRSLINLYNASGQKLRRQWSSEQGNTRMDLSGLAAGIYLVEVLQEGAVSRTKLIKQ